MRKIVFIAFFYSIPVLASQNTLEFHLDCTVESEDCIQIEGYKETIRIRKEPSLALTPEDISHAEKVPDGKGAVFLQLSLKEAAAAKLGELTRKNLGKYLHLLTDSQHVISPMIRDEVSTQFTLSFHPTLETIEKLAWLEKLADETAHEKETGHGLKLVILGICAALCFVGVILLKRKVKFRKIAKR